MEILKGENRYYLVDGDTEIGEITYSVAGENLWIVDHTYVDDAYRGQNLAQSLVKRVVEAAREDNKKIIPLCPFAASEFSKHAEYADVKAKS